jgi:hypothetical protein
MEPCAGIHSNCRLLATYRNNNLPQINQVNYWRFNSKTRKHYNYLQRKLKQKWLKWFTKSIKIPSWESLVQVPSGLVKSVRKRKRFHRRAPEGREHFTRANINNQPKSLYDTNIRVRWNWLTVTNTLAFCKAAIITSVTLPAPIVSFPGANILNSLQSQLTVAPK